MPGYEPFLLCDFHVHTTWSDGRLSVCEVVDLYGQTGRFDVIAITDHTLMKRDMLGRAGRWASLGMRHFSVSEDRFRSYRAGLKARTTTAETVDLQAIPALIGGPTESARLQPKQATPAYVQYDKPPVSFDGEVVGVGDVEGFRPRFRLYDYGVLSIALTRPFSGAWSDLVAGGQMFIEDVEFEQRAERLCRQVADRLRTALTSPRATYLSEDYLVYVVTEIDRPQSAEDVLALRGGTSPPCCAESVNRSASRKSMWSCSTGSPISPTIS